MKTDNSNYIITGGKEGKDRLNILSEVLYPYVKSLLETQGIKTGMSFLDLGCGGGNVSLMVANIVGEAGNVTAIDFDEKIIALNKEDAIATKVHNVSFIAGSAYDICYNNEFDIAYSRFLLSHLKYPAETLQKMVQSVKPGSKVIVEDIHFSGHFCYPACSASDDYIAYFKTAAVRNGHNADLGPQLPGFFHEAGLQNIGFDVIQPAFSTGLGKWMAYITLDKIRNALLDTGTASPQTIDVMLAELETFTNDERTIISLPRIFRVWGSKP